jgi:protein-disulfide isomerase
MENYEPILASTQSEPEHKKGFKFRMPRFSIDAWLISATTLVSALLICLTIFLVNGSFPSFVKFGGDDIEVGAPDTLNSAKLIDDDDIMGNKNAKVTIVEFSDYQCSFCRRFWSDTLPPIKKEYIDTGKVKFVYRDFPLNFHPSAQASAEAAECAADQGKFWEMHDKLFAEQAKKGTGTIQYTVNDIKSWAVQIGLNSTTFNSCLDSGKYKSEVDKDAADGAKIGINGTPGFIIGSQTISGAYPFSEFKRVIDSELAK